MPLGNLLTAVKARWDDQSLDDTVAGGIHESFPSKDVDMPWVIFRSQPSAVIQRANTGTTVRQFEAFSVTFTLYHNLGIAVMSLIVDAIRLAFDYAPLTFTSDDVYFCQYQGQSVDDSEPLPNARSWTLRYEILASRDSDASPT